MKVSVNSPETRKLKVQLGPTYILNIYGSNRCYLVYLSKYIYIIPKKTLN